MRDIAAGVAIVGFTGPNGVGKTLLAAESALCDMQAGRPVYSTVQITSKYGNSIPITSLGQLLELRNATIFLDEVSVMFSARTTSVLPPQMVTFLQVLRHKQNRLIWTAPEWMRCDTLIRGVTQGAVTVNRLWAGRPSRNDPWPRPRIVMAGLLDTSQGKKDAAPTKVMRRRLFIPSQLESFGVYDTLADTPQLGMGRYTGRCECGGPLPAVKHTRERHEALGLPWVEDVERASVEFMLDADSVQETHQPPTH